MTNYGPYGSTPPPGSLDPTTLLQPGFGGFSYGDPEGMGPGAVGTPSILKGQFPQTANYILQGSQGAANEIMRGFHDQYRHKAEGIAAGNSEYQDRLSGETASQGFSPELVRRMLVGSNRNTQAQIGSAFGDSEGAMHEQLAELLKGTGSELAGLKRDQIALIMQAYLAKKARYRPGPGAAIGTAVGGGAGAFFGGTAGASAGAQIGGSLGGAFG